MLIDANLLLYAVNVDAPQHGVGSAWLTQQLNGARRVGIPWQSLGAFLRISTHPRAFAHPLSPAVAWDRVADWLAAPATWIPEPGRLYSELLGEMVVRYELRGNLIPDAHLAALALEHGLSICSADTDFARFTEIRWQNPVG